MLSPIKKNQTAILVGLVTVFVVIGLVWGVPGVNFSFFKLLSSLEELQKENEALEDRISAYHKAKINEAHDHQETEKDAMELNNFKLQLLDRDPSLWFIKMFDEEHNNFRLNLTNPRKGPQSKLPEGMQLPSCQLYTYTVTAEGDFADVGRFVASIENKYPLLAVREISLRSKSPESALCSADIQFRILAKKSEH